ncbi:MAG TPA: hypothetical protein VGN97_11785 [Mesorhizobium sp.]|jgi:hypothetical protein|nr:hypothetical protein [Mesorhizobium sp.]
MPLQNRVDPFGEIHAVDTRGLFTGNRGVIHDPDSRALLRRRWTTKAWIVCALEWCGRRRDVMGRNTPSGRAGSTALFFLDEVTALAAGHRPCFFCRNAAARRFARGFAAGQGGGGIAAPTMDAALHRERAASSGKPLPLWERPLTDLPEGAMVADGSAVFARRGDSLLPWRFAGYNAPLPLREAGARSWRLVTPPSTVAALRAGFSPEWHGSADQPA